MKKSLVVFAVLGLIVFTSCQQRVDVGKEKEAIKAVFEADKSAYFNRDYVSMGETWAKEPSSMKIWQSDTGLIKIEGWENVNASQRKETEDDSWDRKKVNATFSNYQIDVMNDSAWVVCDTDWGGVVGDKPMKLRQSRIAFLKKINGEWKFSLIAIYQIPEAQASEN